MAFDDARSFLTYRYGGNYNNLASVAFLYPGNGSTAFPAAPIFRTDNIDEYSDGQLLRGPTNVDEISPVNLAYRDDPTKPWSGADNPNHYFSSQDFFDPAKTSTFFTNRLYAASTNASTYDQDTFYRLLAQLGTDSAPDDSDKLNLNYKNVGGLSATNFVPWTPLDFFTNAANRLLARYTQDWMDTDTTYYTNYFGTNQAFGLTSIPVVVSNRFVYAPSVHRLLQLAANLTDTRTTNRWPSVFRPIFTPRQRSGFTSPVMSWRRPTTWITTSSPRRSRHCRRAGGHRPAGQCLWGSLGGGREDRAAELQRNLHALVVRGDAQDAVDPPNAQRTAESVADEHDVCGRSLQRHRGRGVELLSE